MPHGFTNYGGRYKTRTCGCFALRAASAAFPCGTAALNVLRTGHKFESFLSTQKRKPATLSNYRFMVDDTRLELVTSRTSSGCATSCANRPVL